MIDRGWTMLNAAPKSPPRHSRGGATVRLALLVLAACCVASLARASAVLASDEEVRVTGSCGDGAKSSLRLGADDGQIRIRFRVESSRRHSSWQVVIVRERRVVWRSWARSDGGGSLDVALHLRDLPGADQIIARAVGPSGITCIAAGTLRA
jgi:hypothetical protein